jgi:hypothetical protein
MLNLIRLTEFRSGSVRFIDNSGTEVMLRVTCRPPKKS